MNTIEQIENIKNMKHKYYQNGIDVTLYVLLKKPMPMSERFFEVTVR